MFVLPAVSAIVNASSIACCCAAVRVSISTPFCATAVTDTVDSLTFGVSVRSRSVNVIEPVSLRSTAFTA